MPTHVTDGGGEGKECKRDEFHRILSLTENKRVQIKVCYCKI